MSDTEQNQGITPDHLRDFGSQPTHPKDPNPSDSQDDLDKFAQFCSETEHWDIRNDPGYSKAKQAIRANYLPKTEVASTTTAVLEKLRQHMRMHTVPYDRGLITRRYLENAIDFEIAQLHKKGIQ